MKKAVFIILFALPIFLMVTISVTGRLIELYVPIPVESIHFEFDGKRVSNNSTIIIGKDKTTDLKAVVLPGSASNKLVYYQIINDSYITFDSDEGKVSGLEYGTAQIIATTDDKNLVARIFVEVADKDVSSVKLNENSLALRVGGKFKLTATITPSGADDKRVTWTSSNPGLVSVEDGMVTALAATSQPVTITVTTMDGGFTDICEVTVEDGVPAIAFYLLDGTLHVGDNPIAATQQIDLFDYLRINGELVDEGDKDSVTFKRDAGSKSVLNGSIVAFESKGSSNIKITATAVVDGKTEVCTVMFFY